MTRQKCTFGIDVLYSVYFCLLQGFGVGFSSVDLTRSARYVKWLMWVRVAGIKSILKSFFLFLPVIAERFATDSLGPDHIVRWSVPYLYSVLVRVSLQGFGANLSSVDLTRWARYVKWWVRVPEDKASFKVILFIPATYIFTCAKRAHAAHPAVGFIRSVSFRDWLLRFATDFCVLPLTSEIRGERVPSRSLSPCHRCTLHMYHILYMHGIILPLTSSFCHWLLRFRGKRRWRVKGFGRLRPGGSKSKHTVARTAHFFATDFFVLPLTSWVCHWLLWTRAQPGPRCHGQTQIKYFDLY